MLINPRNTALLVKYDNIKDITKKNFGLNHVYFFYTVFRVTYRTIISKGYMTTLHNRSIDKRPQYLVTDQNVRQTIFLDEPWVS